MFMGPEGAIGFWKQTTMCLDQEPCYSSKTLRFFFFSTSSLIASLSLWHQNGLYNHSWWGYYIMMDYFAIARLVSKKTVLVNELFYFLSLEGRQLFPVVDVHTWVLSWAGTGLIYMMLLLDIWVTYCRISKIYLWYLTVKEVPSLGSFPYVWRRHVCLFVCKQLHFFKSN